MLASISFMTPMMLGGAVLVALPIVAHLLNRRARRKVVFPSLMLLAASSASQSHLFKLRRWVLLALRCLAVVLVVLAFARPMWLGTEARAVDEQGVAAVLVVDVSASVGQRHEGVSAIESLRAAGGRTLDSLLMGADRVNLIAADANPRPVFPAFTGNVEAMRQAFHRLEPSAERADHRAAIAEAGRMLAEYGGQRRLVILSDFQATNWQSLLNANSADLNLPVGIEVTFVPVELPRPNNTALNNATVRPWPLIAGQAGHASVEVVNYGGDTDRTRVELRRGDELIEQREIEIDPWARREVSFDIRLNSPGVHRLSFHLPDDALMADNARHVVAMAAKRVPVLVIGDDMPDEVGSATYFLSRALAPHGDQRDDYHVRHLVSSEARVEDLRGVSSVFISKVEPMPDELISALVAHMQRGGGVVIFSGSGSEDDNLKALASHLDSDMPWQLGEPRDPGTWGDAMTLDEADWSARLLSPFNMASRGTLQRIRFRRMWTVEQLSDETRVLMRFDDGTPALGQRPVGAGQLVLANFSPALRDSDLGKYGAFVAMMQRMAEVLRPREAPSESVSVGHAVTLMVDEARLDSAGPAPRLVGPGARTLSESEIHLRRDRLTATAPVAATPGFYRLMQGSEMLATAAVNVDPRESDLRRLNLQRLSAALNEAGARTTVREAQTDGPMLMLRGRPLWGWLLAAALAALGLEMALVAWWRR